MKKKVVSNEFFAVVAERLRAGSSVRLSVMGDSMYPLIHGGKDEIQLRPVVPGEVLPLFCAVFYQWEGHYMIHRLIRREKDVLVMLGDGNIYREEKVPAKEILGVLTFIFRPDGKQIDCLSPEWLQKGRRWHRLLPIRRYLLFILKRLRGFGWIE